MRAQAERFGTEIVAGQRHSASTCSVASVHDHAGRRPSLTTTDALIIATGASARWLEIGSDRKLSGHGVSTCATCDGYFFRGKPIAVVGGGDSAMEEAIYLTRVRVEGHRHPPARHAARVEDHAGQGVRESEDRLRLGFGDRSTSRTSSKGEVTGIVLRNLKTGERHDLPLDGVFIAIGHTPNTSLFKGQIDLDANGYIVTHDGTRTNMPGVFAPATCRITSTGRRSPPRVPAAWRRSTPSAISTTCRSISKRSTSA